jgi:CHAT domain-containing protein
MCLKKSLKQIIFFFIIIFFQNHLLLAKDSWIGIFFDQNTPKLKEYYSLATDKGLLVSIVYKKSPADNAGLKAGDIIIAANKEDVSVNFERFKTILNNKNPGDILELEILRGNNENKNFKIKIGDIKYSDIKAPITSESEKFATFLYWPGWGIKTPDNKISKIYSLINPELVKRYDTKNWIITCLDKRSDLYKKGVKLYDEILTINDQSADLYQYSNKPFNLKVKRDSKIILFKNVQPIIDSPIERDFTCVPEFASSICSKLLFVRVTDDNGKLIKELAHKNNLDIYECCEKNKVTYLPFLEADEGKSLRMDFFRFYLGDLIFENKDKSKLSKYIKVAEEEMKKVDEIKKKFPDYKLPSSYYEIVDLLTQTNLYAQGFREDSGINYDETSNINKLKNKIDSLANADTKSLENLKKIKSNIYYLMSINEFDYLQKLLSKIIDANYLEDKDEYIELIGQFYLDLAKTYYDQFDIKKYSKIIVDAENWLKKKSPSPYTKVLYAKILNDKSMRILLSDTNYMNEFKKRDWKLVDNYLNEFNLLPVSEQKKILEIDSDYLYAGYSSLGGLNNWLNFSDRHYSYYFIKALEAIEANPKIGAHVKIYVYVNFLIAASANQDDINVNRILLDIKNYLIEAKGKDQYLVAIRNNLGGLFNFYENKEFFSEMNDFLNFYDKTFNIKTKGELNTLDLTNIWFYFSAKSEIERNKNNYEKSLNYLEEIIKIPHFKLDYLFEGLRMKKQLDLSQQLVLLRTLPDLYDGYYRVGKIEKIKELTLLGLNLDIDNLSYENLSEILVLNNPIRILNPLFSYYVKTNKREKAKMVAKFMSNNFDKITYEGGIGDNKKNPSDFTYNAIELIKNDEKKLAYDLYNQANKLVLKKYNDTLFNSIWRNSNKDLNSSIDFLEGSNFLDTQYFFEQAYSTAQIIKNANFSREIIKGYLSKKNQDNLDIVEYNNLEKELISLIKMEEFQLDRSKKNSTQDKFQKNFELKKNKFDLLESKIKKNNPEYFKSIKIEGININEVQKLLKNNQALIDYYFSQNKLAIVIIKKNSYNVHIENININNLNLIKRNIRKSLEVDKDRKLVAYDLKNAFKLNEIVFLNIKKYLAGINYLYIVPDGPLNEIPLQILPKNDGISCTNCSGTEWNFSDYTFNYLASLDSFQSSNDIGFLAKILKNNFEKIYDEFNTNINLNKIKNKTTEIVNDIFKFPDNNENVIEKNFIKTKYFGVGDPDLYLKKQKSIDSLNLDRFAILRSLNLDNSTRSIDISSIYSPLKSSRDEILFAAKAYGEENSLILLRENATETKIKESDLRNFNIIHFATHAEVSGALKGLNEPFLVLSPPKENTEKDNGLLMMNEIMQLNLNADLVILSACNTGSAEDEYSGSYSGLAKAFFVAGAKSVLVSNWYVEDKATQKLIKKFIENSLKDQISFAESLNITMKELSKENNQYSHPIFWAPFVFVGIDKEINKNLN